MIGGYQRKMYYIRDTRSRVFKEAYFVLREGAEADPVCENDLAAEADRILREHFPRGKRKKKLPKYFPAIMFVAGIIIGAAAMGILI